MHIPKEGESFKILLCGVEEYEARRPKVHRLPSDHKFPDALIVQEYSHETEEGGRRDGAVIQLLSDKAFEALPEAEREGPAKGLLWVSWEDIGEIHALADYLGLEFHADLFGA